MHSKLITTQITWQHLIAELPWNPRRAEDSARLAFSKAHWLGMSRDEAIGTILDLPAAAFLREHPSVLLSAWSRVGLELSACEMTTLEPKPPFETAA